MTKMWPLWHKECCAHCGEEDYATRTQPCKPYKYVCEVCEAYERGYEDGKEQGFESGKQYMIDEMRKAIDTFPEIIKKVWDGKG